MTDSKAQLRQIFRTMDGNRAQEIREAYYKALEGLITLAGAGIGGCRSGRFAHATLGRTHDCGHGARCIGQESTGSDTVIEVNRIESSGWVIGRVGEYRFNAMIFREHAADPSWELAGSKISKLWIQHQGKTVFNWDRGMDIDAKTEEVQDVVVLLCSEKWGQVSK